MTPSNGKRVIYEAWFEVKSFFRQTLTATPERPCLCIAL